MTTPLVDNSQGFAAVYRRFEDRFRGSRELIKDRLRIYLPLVRTVASSASGGMQALDIGCGRGEWLELLGDENWQARGIELSADMAAVSTANGLDVSVADAMEVLRSVPDASISLVSAFHVVEHVTTDYLIAMLRQMVRVLAPGGILILETPNPENLRVGTWAFYMDPTHEKPLPPLLLQFFVHDAGLPDAEVLRLNGEPESVSQTTLESALRPLLATSMDYAIVARKQIGDQASDLLGDFVRANTQRNPDDLSRLTSASTRLDSALTMALDTHREIAAFTGSTNSQLQLLADRVELQSSSDANQLAALAHCVESQSRLTTNQLQGFVDDLKILSSFTAGQLRELRDQVDHQASSTNDELHALAGVVTHRVVDLQVFVEQSHTPLKQLGEVISTKVDDQRFRLEGIGEALTHLVEQALSRNAVLSADIAHARIALEAARFAFAQREQSSAAELARQQVAWLELSANVARREVALGEQHEVSVQGLLERLAARDSEFAQANAKVHELNASSHHWWQRARQLQNENAKIDDLSGEIAALRNSWSWRITGPVRVSATLAFSVCVAVKRLTKQTYLRLTWLLALPVVALIRFVVTRPALRARAYAAVMRLMPWAGEPLYQFALARGVSLEPAVGVGSTEMIAAQTPVAASALAGNAVEVTVENLTPSARDIYVALASAHASETRSLP